MNKRHIYAFIQQKRSCNIGKLMFSELWIDADEEKKEKDSETEKNIKILIKFDIKNLGFFDLIINYKNDIIDMNLFYPERLSSNEKIIKSEITDIVKRNGLKVNSLQLEKSIKPKTVSEVFSKIYERKNSINVRI